MSISSISSASSTVSGNYENPFAQRRANFQALQQSLQSGDLSGAQKAFAALQKSAPPPPPPDAQDSSGDQSGKSNSFQSDFEALGQALQSGDLTEASKAFETLQSDMQAARQASGNNGVGGAQHRHHHRQQDVSTSLDSSLTSTSSSVLSAALSTTSSGVSYVPTNLLV